MKRPSSLWAACALSVSLFASPAALSVNAPGGGPAAGSELPPMHEAIESTSKGEWADLSIEEHVLKAVIEGASRGPAPAELEQMFLMQTRSTEPVEVRAERKHGIAGQPGCAVVNLYFYQEGVPVFKAEDTDFSDPVDHVPFEMRYEMERCADGDAPDPKPRLPH